MKGFKNALIYVEGKGLIKTSLAVDGDKIVAIDEKLDVEDLVPLKEGYLVAPGFIDEHIHGAASSDAMDGTLKDLGNIAPETIDYCIQRSKTKDDYPLLKNYEKWDSDAKILVLTGNYIPSEKAYEGILEDISTGGCRLIATLPIKAEQHIFIDYNADEEALLKAQQEQEDEQEATVETEEAQG